MSEALLTRTENNAVTYAGSGNPLVDFFFQASPPSSAQPILFSRTHCVSHMQAMQCVDHVTGVATFLRLKPDGVTSCQ